MKVAKDGKEVWVQVVAYITSEFTITIVEKGGMAQNIVATAVVQALVGKYSISAARLKAYGVGPLAPVASNDKEEGRANNRRVELVKR